MCGRGCAAAVLVAVLACSSPLLGAKEVAFIDLTEPAEYPRSERGFPIMGGGGIGGERIGPEPYPVALEVRVVGVEPAVVGLRDEFVLEVELRNAGADVFFFPLSRDRARMQEDGNRDRRSAGIWVHNRQATQNRWGCGLLWGTASIPESLARLNPGDWIVMRVKTSFYGLGVVPMIPEDAEKALLGVGYIETTLKDDEFDVLNISQRVRSTNGVTLTVKHDSSPQ